MSNHRHDAQAHHGAREVFLTEVCDENEGDWLLRPARVLPLDGFQEASGGDYSDDVFLCEYEYNKGFQVMHHACCPWQGWAGCLVHLRACCAAKPTQTHTFRSLLQREDLRFPLSNAKYLCSRVSKQLHHGF